MLTKQKLIKAISGLPDIFSLEEVIDRIVLLQKIEIGIEQADKGQSISTMQAKKKLKKWLK
jgi:hypothetical protein